MTLLEKAMEINKEKGEPSIENNIVDCTCPSDYGLEAPRKCKNDDIKHCECEACWNREMPDTELVKTVTLPMPPNTEPHFSNPVIEKAYNTGLNDAWELARKINNMEFKEFIKVFERTGYDGREVKMHLIDDLTPQEALAKLKVYEEAQSKIEVGDVVKVNGRAIVVNAIRLDCVLGLDRTGEFYEVDIDKCEKTGKHLELANILEQIGE